MVSSIAARLGGLLASEKYCDCSFRSWESLDDRRSATVTRCHRIVLATASPVFEAMLFGGLSNQATDIIDIADITTATFRTLIDWIYTDRMPEPMQTTLNEMMELYLSATKYLIFDLTNHCLDSIRNMLTADNVLALLDAASQVDLDQLVHTCLANLAELCWTKCDFVDKYYFHVSAKCVNVIVHAIQGDVVHRLVTRWMSEECCLQNLDVHNAEHVAALERRIDRVRPPDQHWYGHGHGDGDTRQLTNLNRKFYRAVAPFIVGDTKRFTFTVQLSRRWALAAVCLNTRMPPPRSAADYTESLDLCLFDGHKVLIHSQRLKLLNTKYNSIVDLALTQPVILEANRSYAVVLVWHDNAFGAEYPRAFVASSTTSFHNAIDAKFDGDSFDEGGTLVTGIKVFPMC